MVEEENLIAALRDHESRARSTFAEIGLEPSDALIIIKHPDLDVPEYVRWLSTIVVMVPMAIEGLHDRPSAETALLVHHIAWAAGRVGLELSKPAINAARASRDGAATARAKRWARERNAVTHKLEIRKAKNMMAVGSTVDDILAALGCPASQNRVKADARKKLARILRENNALPARRRRAKNG